MDVVGGFKYLRRVLKNSDYDWNAFYVNLAKVRKCWVCFRKILGREGAYVRTSGMFY